MGLTVFNQFPQLTRLLAAPSVGEMMIYLFTETSPMHHFCDGSQVFARI